MFLFIYFSLSINKFACNLQQENAVQHENTEKGPLFALHEVLWHG